MIVMLSAVALFALGAWIRGGAGAEPPLATIALGLVGAALLGAGGWMGGVLVSRNQISVDHRYAGAGKWREATIDGKAGDWVEVARADELAVDQMKLLRAGDRRLVLGRTEDGWVAFDDHCTHRGASLADGVLICGTVQCPWHGSQFEARTGRVVAGPAKESIATHEVREEGETVRLRLPAADQ
jgi:nitrite reductase/ring-hydroxylating ferredoxin subunit